MALPAYLKLMRFHRPVGILLLLWPTLWALWIASQGHPQLKILTVMILGVILMRAAGCVINDIADRKFDGLVARTRDRPLVTGAVQRGPAWALFISLLLIAFGLVLLLNTLTIYLAFIGAGLAVIYPLMKRYIVMPQFILGMAFAWGIPMAFAAQTHQVGFIAWYLYVTTLIWIVIYDTMYAMADRDDDIKLGIKSSAIFFNKYDKIVLAILQIIFLGLLLFLGRILRLGVFYDFALILVSALFVYQQYLLRERQPTPCFQAFLNNQWVGLIIFLGLLLNYK